jgi:predicted DNA-binding transcriptional regulator AlpA
MEIENKLKIDKTVFREFIIEILWEEIPKILETQKEQKEELLTIYGVMAICKKSRQTIYNWLHSEKYKNSFPRPKRIASTNYWLKSEILSFQKSLDI